MPDRLELHRARVQRGIDLAHISASTSLNPKMAARIDAGRFEELPAGVYARSYVRTFARAVGLPPDKAVASIAEYLPTTDDPLAAMLERAPKSPMEGFWLFVASQLRPYPAVESLLCDASRRRAAAATLDAVLLTTIGIATVGGTAWISGVGVQRLLELAGGQLALMFSVPVALYFMLLDGLRVPTLGKVLCGSGTSSLRARGVRIQHWTYGRRTAGRIADQTARRDAGHIDRRTEHLALRSAPARR